jgi:REP element-mobilizing transposase RayT
MQIEAFGIYHVYNQGNQKQTLFFEPYHYQRFIELTRYYVYPKCDILAYCLMPNHFHFMISATELSATQRMIGKVESNELSNAFRVLLSRYCQEMNRVKNETGSMFRQKTKMKLMENTNNGYANSCFEYIHFNPEKAGLVDEAFKWKHSSLAAFLGMKRDILINRKIATYLLDLPSATDMRKQFEIV